MKRLIAPSAIFIILLAVYLWTLAPGSFWIDSAAFATCNEILGLPHSPSFPLYTLMGRVAHVLLPVAPATASNIFSAVTAASAGVLLYMIMLHLLPAAGTERRRGTLAAACAAIFACLSVPVWQSAVRAEVYALNILLSLAVVYAFLKTYEGNGSRATSLTLLAVFIQGLSLTNHPLLAMVTMPLVLVLLCRRFRAVEHKDFAKIFAWAATLTVVAFSVYVYLPVRAAQNPAINSGRPVTPAAAVGAITRSDDAFLPQAPTPPPDYSERAAALVAFLFEQTGGLIVVGLAAALFWCFRERQTSRLYLLGLIPLGLAVVVWAADFRLFNFDIVAYGALPLILMVAFAFYGLVRLGEGLAKAPGFARLAPVIFVFMAFFEFYGNLYASDLSASQGSDVLARSILEKAPPRAILILNEDNLVLPMWYHCYALGERPDIAILAVGTLYRPSYREHIKILYPALMYPPGFDVGKIEDMGLLMNDFCSLNAERPIQVQFGVDGIAAGRLRPDGFLFRYTVNAPPVNYNSACDAARILDEVAGSASDLLTLEFAARSAFNFGVYFDQVGMADAAFQFFEYAIETDDENPEYLLRLGIAFLNAGKNREAVLLLRQAMKTGDGCPEAEMLLKKLDIKLGQI